MAATLLKSNFTANRNDYGGQESIPYSFLFVDENKIHLFQ